MNRHLIAPRRQLPVFVLACSLLLALTAVAMAKTDTLPIASNASVAQRQTALGVDRGQLSVRSQLRARAALDIGPEQLSAPPLPARPPAVSMTAKLIPIPAPAPTPAPVKTTVAPSGGQLSGIASTYCCTRGFTGQAVVALAGGLGGRYTGNINGYVTVCADRCATFPVVDYCQCYWGTADQRLVDLSPEAWYAISDLPRSRGLLAVRVTLPQ